MESTSLESIINICKRRGFIFPSSEIYGGVASLFDYGPLGIELRKNIKELWWKTFIQERQDVVGLDSSIIMHPRVWEASGHLENFTDPLVECDKCHFRFREDHLPQKDDKKFWKCLEGGDHQFGEARPFNMLFKTYLGAVEETASVAYLRPETAQGMFTNFKNIVETMRQKVPFGIAQWGKAFRNEVGLGNFLFRLREFEIAELEYFVKPGDDERAFEEWRAAWLAFYVSVGLAPEHLKYYEKGAGDIAHYSKATHDLHYLFPFGWDEVGAVANRTDYDLKRHTEYSGKDLSYFDQETHEKFVPYVIEPTMGVDRVFLAVLCEAYREYPGGRKLEVGTEKLEADGGGQSVLSSSTGSTTVETGSGTQNKASGSDEETEIVLHLNPKLAPYKVAILPLVKKGGLKERAEELTNKLRKTYMVYYDESGSIGRRYRRQDEIGTPWCATLDFQTLEDNTVTIRDRDTMVQERVNIDELEQFISEKLNT